MREQTEKQRSFLQDLVTKKDIPAEVWKEITEEFKIETKDDLAGLSFDEATKLIQRLTLLPWKEEREKKKTVASPITQAQAVSVRVPMPVATPQEAMNAWKIWQEMKMVLKDENDVVVIDGREFLKKSFWRKVATFFGISDTRVIYHEIERDKDGEIVGAEFVIEVEHQKTGQKAIGFGRCSIRERAHKEDKKDSEGNVICRGPCDGRRHFVNIEHTIPATAFTRAKNRAISDMVGGGEVSAEEIEE